MKKLTTLLTALALVLGNVANAQSYVLDFDGVDDYVDVGVNVGNNVRTFELWFMPTIEINSTISDFQGLVFRRTQDQTHEFALAFHPQGTNGGQLGFGLRDAIGTPYQVFSDTNQWNAGQWYHVAGVSHPQNGMSLYIDGVKQIDTDLYSSASTSHTTITAIGRWGESNIRHFNGRIEDVRFSNNAIYTSNFTPPCPDITAMPNSQAVWNFNEGTGLVTVDSSGNGYDGTIYGATYVMDSICTTISINEHHASNSIELFPNPTEGKFKVESSKLKVEKVEVYDLFGRKVLESKEAEIDMSSYPAGLYIWRVGEARGKVVIE